ncbi:hypothetical protein AKJ08_1475 [Vulgatibacter incomptus]|uniref:Uncharacterized protein n=1 Tax=Vulgatibacter incomptus TaxID=1391653 RepID=A0A0K1PC26_9BACT|nr:hypothetical protein AKJ08_1475 [Vulgatibacter incomptus]
MRRCGGAGPLRAAPAAEAATGKNVVAEAGPRFRAPVSETRAGISP